MKKLLTIAITLSSVLCMAQSTSTDLSEIKANSIMAKFSQRVLNGDTVHYVYMSWRNAKYEHIIDVGSLLLTTKNEIETFISDLKKCMEKTANRKDNISFSRENYSLSVSQYNTYICFTDNGKYNYVFKNKSSKLLEWVESIDTSLML